MKPSKLILLVDDSEHDRELALEALKESAPDLQLVAVADGAEALDFLNRRGQYSARDPGPPSVILLDLKMPRVDGVEVLRQIKGDDNLKTIPVVMMTTSREQTDVTRSYQSGANAYVMKPLDFEQFSKVMTAIESFWIEHNEPPISKPSSE